VLARAPSGDGSHFTLHALAAATPSRKLALQQLLHALEEEPARKENIRRAAHVSSLLGDCGHLTSLLISHGYAEEADQTSKACGVPIDGDAYVWLGEVELASGAYARDRRITFRSCSTHAAAKHFTLAAECLRELAKVREPVTDDGSRERAQALNPSDRLSQVHPAWRNQPAQWRCRTL
jgi:hypothetical protein